MPPAGVTFGSDALYVHLIERAMGFVLFRSTCKQMGPMFRNVLPMITVKITLQGIGEDNVYNDESIGSL